MIARLLENAKAFDLYMLFSLEQDPISLFLLGAGDRTQDLEQEQGSKARSLVLNYNPAGESKQL